MLRRARHCLAMRRVSTQHNATNAILNFVFASPRLASLVIATQCRSSLYYSTQRNVLKRSLMDKENRRPDFNLHIDTRLLIEKLREVAYGESVTYNVLSEMIGRNVQK